MINFDFSTIDPDVLAAFPDANMSRYKSLHIDEHYGAGCAGDPPGYPSYFVQNVCTAAGNSPTKHVPSLVLDGKIVAYADDSIRDLNRRYRHLYQPLPFESERVQIWVATTMQHFWHCYNHPTEKEYNRAKTVIYPLPYYEKEPERKFKDDPRFSDAWRQAERERIAQENAWVRAENNQREIERAAICSIANHAGVITIRRWYPEFTPIRDQFERGIDLRTGAIELSRTQANQSETHPTPPFQTEWVYRYDHKPTPEECPGWLSEPHGETCRMCGNYSR